MSETIKIIPKEDFEKLQEFRKEIEFRYIEVLESYLNIRKNQVLDSMKKETRESLKGDYPRFYLKKIRSVEDQRLNTSILFQYDNA